MLGGPCQDVWRFALLGDTAWEGYATGFGASRMFWITARASYGTWDGASRERSAIATGRGGREFFLATAINELSSGVILSAGGVFLPAGGAIVVGGAARVGAGPKTLAAGPFFCGGGFVRRHWRSGKLRDRCGKLPGGARFCASRTERFSDRTGNWTAAPKIGRRGRKIGLRVHNLWRRIASARFADGSFSGDSGKFLPCGSHPRRRSPAPGWEA